MLLLHRYRPFTVEGLALLASADLAERQKAAYNADMMWFTAKIVYSFAGGKHFDIDSPSQFAREIDSRKPKDNRTAQQIKDDLIAALDKRFPD